MFARQCAAPLLVSLWFACEAYAEEKVRSFPLAEIKPGVVIAAASLAEGKAAMTQRDEFIAALSDFDRQARMRSVDRVTEVQFLEFLAGQVLPWDHSERSVLRTTCQSLSQRLSEFDVPLPDKVLLVKTTGAEEGCYCYCRGDNAIMIPRRIVESQRSSLERLILRQLFHISLRHRPEMRDQLYALVGFVPCAPLRLPSHMQCRRVTHPDTPCIRHCLPIQSFGRQCYVTPLLVTSVEKFSPQVGRMSRYVDFRLLPIDVVSGSRDQAPEFMESFFLDAEAVPEFFDRTTMNTMNVSHPEQILADNFVHLVRGTKRLNAPELVYQLRAYYQRSSQPMLATKQ
ncbi:MAG: hypothetical protein R3C99_22125 [Pirellulaceae bacterium]